MDSEKSVHDRVGDGAQARGSVTAPGHSVRWRRSGVAE
jgi:hypothetical protein